MRTPRPAPSWRDARALAVALLTFLILATSAAPAAARSATIRTDRTLAKAVATEIDRVREEQGLARLDDSGPLRRAATRHARTMGRLGFFSHRSADGTAHVRRIESQFRARARSGLTVGEVIFWATGRPSAREIVAQWLASSIHHRELLLGWDEIGPGAVRADSAPGVFGGRDVTIVVVDFARRS